MLSQNDIRNRIETSSGQVIADMRIFSRGNNADLYLADLADGKRIVVKIATAPDTRFDIEAWMLGYLNDNSDLPVPRVYFARKDMLVMSYIESAGVIDARIETHAAELLAQLHRIEGRMFGLEKNTLIGPLLQPNPPSKSWVSFFTEHRLLYMAREAFSETRISRDLMKNIDRLAGKIDRYLSDDSSPRLIHGDIWGGNVLAGKGRVSGFIDPAIYYADPEIELAFISLFHTFNEPFYKRYSELNPIREGFFEERKDIYNLYPLLVHARLFGSSYEKAAKEIVNRFV